MPQLKRCLFCNEKFDRPLRSQRDPNNPFKISWSQYRKVKFCSPECRHKYQSKILSGKNSYNWKGGKPKCLDCGKLLTSYSRKRCKPCSYKFRRGINHQGYKQHLGNYKYLHAVVRENLGDPEKCVHCGKTGQRIKGKWTIHWANISGKYLRDASDWIALCVPCHKKYDNR